MLAVGVVMLVWGLWIYQRLRTMYDPSQEEDDLRWEWRDWRRIAKWVLITAAALFVVRSVCASFVVAWGDPPTGVGAWFRYWRDWLDAALVGWPV